MSNHIWICVVHVDLKITDWHFTALVIEDVEGDICSSPVMFVAYRRLRPVPRRYRWYLESWPSSNIEGRRRLEHVDIDDFDGDWTGSSSLTSSSPPSTTSSSYAHPFGRVGRRKRSGIFVVFPDSGGVVFHLDMVLEDGVDEVPSQGFGLATSFFRRDHASG